MKTMGIAAGALALASALPAFAQATQEITPTTPPTTGEQRASDFMSTPVRAPSRAFEIGAEGGYTQGFGTIHRGRGVGDVAGAGGTLGVNLGYRINPRWSVGVVGRYEGFGRGSRAPNGTTVRGASGGIEGTFHTAPYSRLDPYVTFGGGYRAVMETPRGNLPTTVTHGFELARVELGLDVRASENVAISPVIGADIGMFMWRSGGGADTATLRDRGVSTFVFAGVKGRFDVGGNREPKPETQVGSR